MSHKGIRLLIEDTAKRLGDDIQFTYAKQSDFNILRDKRYPFISLDPLVASAGFAVNNTSNYTKVWSVSMAFYELDSVSSTQDEYAIILDEVDNLVDRFITKINEYGGTENNNVFNEDNIIIQSISQQPFVKAMADVLTGYLVSFQIVVPDNWNYCIDGC